MDGMEACVQIQQYLKETKEDLSDSELIDSKNLFSFSSIDHHNDSSMMIGVENIRPVPLIHALTSLTDED